MKQYHFNSILLSLAWKKSNLYFLLAAVKHNQSFETDVSIHERLSSKYQDNVLIESLIHFVSL